MQAQCPNASCKHVFEVSSGNPFRVTCPKCGTALPASSTVSHETGSVSGNGAGIPPYLQVPSITDPKLKEIPPLERFQVLNAGERLIKSYQIRVRRPKFPWAAALPSLIIFPVFFAIVAGFLIFRRRGHTFLYLTNQRVIVLELEESLFRRDQSVCHFSIDDICGFQLHAQRGLKKLFGLILLKEKRTFYLAIVTRTCSSVEIGAVNSMRSEYDPGRDAVALCGELDAKVLALQTERGR